MTPSGHAYPQDMVAYMFSKDAQWVDGQGWPPATREELLSIVSNAYQASLLREEGRSITATLCLAEPQDFSNIGKIKEKPTPLVFDQPIELSPHELKKLAPDVASWRTAIGLTVSGSGHVFIWGLCDAVNQNWGGHLEDDRGILVLPPKFNVEIVGPGHIRATLLNGYHVTLRSGQLSGPNQGVPKWARSIGLFRDCAAEAGREAHSKTEPIAGDAESWLAICSQQANGILAGMVQRMVRLVREGGHGGTFVIVPRTPEPQAWRRHVNSKYSFRDSGDLRLREAFFEKVLQFAKWTSEVGGGALGKRGKSETVSRSHIEVGATIEDTFGASTAFVARLTSVDGAVVLSSDLGVHAFGAELVNLPEIPESVTLESAEGMREPTSPRAYGTRHRSAIRFVLANPTAQVFVISQDGRAKCVRMKEGELVLSAID